MCLTFQRNHYEITVKLALVMNPSAEGSSPFNFSMREIFFGGGALPLVRNAVLCLIAALREEQERD
jgi:hypothetical protein